MFDVRITTPIYRRLKQLRVELHGPTWGTCLGPDLLPKAVTNVVGLLEILSRFATMMSNS